MKTTAISKPAAGEVVQQQVLESAQFTTDYLSRGFGGVSNPTTIWQSLITDSWSAFGFMREMEEKDDDVGGLIDDLKLAVRQMERTIVPADDSASAKSLAEEIQDQFARIPNFGNILDGLLDAPGHGVAIAEMIFDVSESQIAITDIKVHPQELFSFNPSSRLQNGPLLLKRSVYSSDGDPVPEEKFIVWTWRPRNGNRRGRPILRGVFWPSWFKRQTLRFWLKYGEKGPGTSVVKFKDGASEDEQSKALRAAEAMVEKLAIAVPENFSFVTELLTAARSINPEVYSALVRRMECSIARRILGQTLTSRGSEDQKGSLALGSVHEEIRWERVKEVADGLETVINDQVIQRLILWNHGPEALAIAPKWTLAKQRAKNLPEQIKIDAEAQRMGVPLSLRYMRETYGYPDISPDDEILEASREAAFPLGGAGGEFAEENLPKEIRKEILDLRRLFDQLKKKSARDFQDRILELTREITAESAT